MLRDGHPLDVSKNNGMATDMLFTYALILLPPV